MHPTRGSSIVVHRSDKDITEVGIEFIVFLVIAFVILGGVVMFISNVDWLYLKLKHCMHGGPLFITGEESDRESQAVERTSEDDTGDADDAL